MYFPMLPSQPCVRPACFATRGRRAPAGARPKTAGHMNVQSMSSRPTQAAAFWLRDAVSPSVFLNSSAPITSTQS
ncbi:MAG: hypothetical protein O9972_27185 [Burkholderiales bacterium]|jgi:hypothetical protein|nr:hypothetical protein [Burkholderiales bacterium]